MRSPDFRAFISLLLASAVPGLAALITSQGERDPFDELLGLAIWYVFSLFIVIPIGAAAYYILRRSRIPFIVSAPVVGALASAGFAHLLYRQGMVEGQLLYFIAVGAVTGLVAVGFNYMLARIGGRNGLG
ncbi:MAG: hypothetical protein ACN6O2_11950 [Stenotrophomonas sp.]